MAKITVKGNTNKGAKLRKVHNGEHEDFVLDFWIAENDRKRDGSVETIWSKVTVWRNYAVAIDRLLNGESRKAMVTGNAKAKFYTTKNGQIVPYMDIQASEVEFLDDKRPEQVPPEVDETANVEQVMEGFTAVETAPWD
jgi:hypothetical protein